MCSSIQPSHTNTLVIILAYLSIPATIDALEQAPMIEPEGADAYIDATSTLPRKPIAPGRRVEEEVEEDSVYDDGYFRATGCASYTISLDTESEDGYQQDPGVSIVGQETFVFFEYTLPYNSTEYDDDSASNNNGGANNTQNRRKLYENGESYSNYYGFNAIPAKDWIVAFSDGALYSGCVEMEDDISVFEDIVPGIADESLSFSTLYYGPICNSQSSTTPVLEMGVFLDPTCNIYVPGLSQVLNRRILSNWKAGVSFLGKRSNEDEDPGALSYSYSRYYGAHGDLQYLDSYESLLYQVNHFRNSGTTYCQDSPEVCEEVTENSVDLNTCHSLALGLWEFVNGYYYENEDDGEDHSEDIAYEYGELFRVENANNDDGSIGDEEEAGESSFHEYHYRMFQSVLNDYSYCVGTPSDDGGCTGWSYGWDNYDCIVNDDDEMSRYYNSDNVCQQGVCYGVLESFEKGYLVSEWLAANAKGLEYEMAHAYKMDTPLVNVWYDLLAICAVMIALLVALAYWTEGILRTFSHRNRLPQKKIPFLDKTTKIHSSNTSTGTIGGNLDSPSNSPNRYKNPSGLLQQGTPKKSNMAFPSSNMKRTNERMKVIGYSRGKNDSSIGSSPLDIGAI